VRNSVSDVAGVAEAAGLFGRHQGFDRGIDRALASGENGGFVKWIADAKTDRLLGAHAIGLHATELIAEAALAVRSGVTAEELGRVVHGHPTLLESWMEAAHTVHCKCIHAAPRRRTA
jgi:dihydrolipoamide dehydrogenase